MPEWPDLHVLKERLQWLVGRQVVTVQVRNPVVVRAVRPLPEALDGRTLTGVGQRGKFLLFRFDGAQQLVVNPMLAGLFHLVTPQARLTRDLAFALGFGRSGAEPGAAPEAELRYRDDKQMGKAYLLEGVPPDQAVPGFAELGPEADPQTLDLEDFIRRGRRSRMEARNLLLDQSIIAGIGNAYADEILFEARLHPKRKLTTLSDTEWRTLADAVRSTVTRAVAAVAAGLPSELGVKVRSHLQVRGRENQPCPRCGTRIVLRSLGYLETNFCPACQPAPPGQLY